MFGRKKEVEATETSDLEIPRSSGVRPKVSRVRKEKEKSKPWGRNERLLVLVPLLFTVVAAALLAISARSWKLPGLPRISLPVLSSEKKIVIEKKSEKNHLEEIRNIFLQKTNTLSGVWGLYFYSFEDDYSIATAEDEKIGRASCRERV